jgi:hypothetical protein
MNAMVCIPRLIAPSVLVPRWGMRRWAIVMCIAVFAKDGLAQGTARVTSDDSAQFAAVVKTLRDSISIPLRVEPRPVGRNLVPLTDSILKRPEYQTLLNARRSLLRWNGVTMDSLELRGCPGRLAPTPPGTNIRATCPASDTAFAQIGIAVTRRGQTVVRVQVTGVGPRGFVQSIYDYILRRRTNQWAVARVIPRTTAE